MARRIGEKDADRAARAAVQSIALGLVVAAFVGTTGALFGPQLLALMGASDDVVRLGGTFTRVMVGGSGTVLDRFLSSA